MIGWGGALELVRGLKRVENTGKIMESESKFLTGWLRPHHPWQVLRMFIGTIVEAIYLVVLTLVPNLCVGTRSCDNTKSGFIVVTCGEAEARGGRHWPSHTEGRSQLWDRPQVCRPSRGALGDRETRHKEKGLLCVGTGVTSLKRPHPHAGHRHRPLGWPLCSLRSAQAALPALVSPASTSSL